MRLQSTTKIFQRIMKKILLLTLLILTIGTQYSHAITSRNLTVSAEPNLALALTKIARIYSQKSHTIVSVNFNSSADLISDIDSGEPADVFISAHSNWIESLRQKGLVDVYNIGYIARDKLVLAALKTNSEISANSSLVDALKFLDQTKANLIIDNDATSSGFFAKNFLSNLDLKNIQLFAKVAEDKTNLISNIKNSDHGYSLMLASQAANEPSLKIIASNNDENIFYQALVIAGDNMDVAREFLKFLKSNDAKSILKENGFLAD